MGNKLDNPPARISFTHWSETVSIEVDHSDVTIEEFFDLCRRLALSAGYGDENVAEFFD